MSTLTTSPLATDTARLDLYLDGVDHLPPTPTLLVKLIGLFRQPDRDVDEIVELMAQDPSLTAEVLRRCSSSFFGSSEPVTDVNEAVFRLGFYEVYRITVAMFGLQAMSMARVTAGLEVEQLWRHSAITAIAGGTLSRHLDESEGVVFTAGLLHDVGKIVFASAEGTRYAEMLREYGNSGQTLYDAEKLIFGFNHGEVGARLLSRWGVPDQVSIPVLCHHQLHWSEPHARLAAIVNLANLMAHCLEADGPEKPCELPEARHAMTLLGLKEEAMHPLLDLAQRDVKRLNSLLSPAGSK
jgi:putative nucleotidyltransferase with HDIG domain